MPRKRRRRSWGSIKSITNMKHILRWMENTPEGRKRRSLTFYGTYKEACFELHRLEVEHSEDKPVPTIGEAFSMWYEPWILRRAEDGKTKQGTVDLYIDCWKRAIEPRWASVPLDSTQPVEIQKWLLGLNSGNAKIATVVLRKIVDFAVQYEIVESNKFRLPYEMPSTKSRVKKAGVFTLEEAETLLGKIKGRPSEAPYILACFGSARTGESLGVRAAEVELVESHGITLAVVPISRRMAQSGDLPLPDGDLKNRQSNRHIVIPEPYGTHLYEIAQDRLAHGTEWLADRGDGLPLNRGAILSVWDRDAGSAAIPFTNLRATWRTFAQYEWMIDHDTLETLMGHAIQGVTGRHYLKPTVDNLVESVARSIVQSRAT